MRRWLLAGCVVMACGDNAPHIPREVVAVPATPTTKLDLLFVVSNEGGTLEIQRGWADAFPTLLAEISIDGRPDLHLGVITPDMGTSIASGEHADDIGGTVGGCHASGDNGRMLPRSLSVPYLIDSDGETNHTGALADDLNLLLELGAGGCGYQQPLSAIRAAFANPANLGFRRPDAALGIVVVSDEDDCSAIDLGLFGADTSILGARQHFRCTQFGVRCAEPDMTTPGPRTACVPARESTIIEDPANFIEVIRGLAEDPRRVAFASVVGPSDDFAIELRAPSGTTSTIPALAHACVIPNPQTGIPSDAVDPGVRLAWLADQFGDRGTSASVCDDDLGSSATDVGIGLRRAMGTSCIDEGIDLGRCVVSDDNDVELPRCGATTTDCYDVATDEATCPHGSHEKLVVHHAAAYTLVRC